MARLFLKLCAIVLFLAGFASLMISVIVWDNAFGGWLTGKGMYFVQTLGLFLLAILLFFAAGLCHKKAKRMSALDSTNLND